MRGSMSLIEHASTWQIVIVKIAGAHIPNATQWLFYYQANWDAGAARDRLQTFTSETFAHTNPGVRRWRSW